VPGSTAPKKTSAWYSTGTNSTSVSVDASFRDDGPTFSSYGVSCGPTLAGWEFGNSTHHNLLFTVVGAFPGNPVVLIFGDKRTSTPLFGCTLYTNPLLSVVVTSDLGGIASWSAVVAKPVRGTVRAQAIPVDLATGRLSASAGLEIVFAD